MTAPLASRLISLPSGSVIAIEEYGVATGRPVFFFHGWPSAAVQGVLLHEAAVELGIHIISVSRPGLGESRPQPGRRMADWPPLIRELAIALRLARFHVLGISGGGPYSLACAWGLPELVHAAAVICGAPPLAEIGTAQGFNLAYRTMLRVHRHFPGLMRVFFRILHPLARLPSPGWALLLLRGALVRSDKETLADPAIAKMCSDGFRCAWGAHRDGVFEDAQLYAEPWGFALEDIRVPVRIWHGTEDRNFSHSVTGYAQRISGAKLHVVEGEGHYSLPIRRAREILADLIAR